MKEIEKNIQEAQQLGLNVISFARLFNLRARLFECIQKSLDEDGHCKSYEGTFSIKLPNFFEQQHSPLIGNEFSISLDCYLIGPNRHYTWDGGTFDEALEKAETEIGKWLEHYQ